MLTKLCCDCACRLPLSEFYREKKAPPAGKSLGVSNVCRFCKSLRRKAWKMANPDKARESRRNRKRQYRARKREERGPYTAPVALRHRDPAAWRAKKRWEKRARELQVKQAQPAWADRQEVAMWYRVAEVLSRGGVPFSVDHVVPLRSALVCGLHAHTNLQILPAHVNHEKGNRHWPGMP